MIEKERKKGKRVKERVRFCIYLMRAMKEKLSIFRKPPSPLFFMRKSIVSESIKAITQRRGGHYERRVSVVIADDGGCLQSIRISIFSSIIRTVFGKKCTRVRYGWRS